MTCYKNGVPVTPGGGARILYDEYETPTSKTTAGYSQCGTSSLTVPAGNWLLVCSLEIWADYPSNNMVQGQLWDNTNSAEIISILETITDVYDYSSHSGIKLVQLTGDTTYQWRYQRLAGTGPVGFRRARISAIEQV